MQKEPVKHQKTVLTFEENNGVTFEYENVMMEEPLEENIADWGD